MPLQLTQTAPSKGLAQWYDSFITNFRVEAAKLTDDEKNKISNTDNYLEPCQIEVFWLERPEFQTIISSRFADRPDREIIINGPFKSYEFIEEVDKVLREPRWNKLLPQSAPYTVSSKRSTLANVMYGIMSNQIRQINSTVFSNVQRPMSFGGTTLTMESWVALFAGNIAETDPLASIDRILDAAKVQAQSALSLPEPQSPSLSPKEIQATIGYFYPPITVGTLPEPKNLREFVFGAPSFLLMNKALQGKVGSEQIVFTKDGLMAVTTNKKPLAIRIFNTISALTLLEGFWAQAIRESETGQGTLEAGTLELRSWGMSGSTPRSMLLEQSMFERFSFFRYPRIPIPEDTLSRIVEKADKILKHPEKTDELILWLESNTHFQDAEYAPSFVISWIMVERNLSNVWETFLRERNVTSDRKHKLANSGLWPADHVLETLNLAGTLDEKKYRALMELKSMRNSFVHEGRKITKDDSLECLDLATEIMKHDLEGLL